MPATGQRKTSLNISKSFKEARELFLTRRFVEAYDTLEPFIALPQISRSEDIVAQDEPIPLALVAFAERKERVRTVNLYIAILDAAAELEPDQGRKEFGSGRWTALADKIRDGAVWEEIVQAAYGGLDGAVDIEVATNLAALLVSKSSSTLRTQQCIESYLSSADNQKPPVPTGGHVFKDGRQDVERSQESSRFVQERKLIELYTLEVLPRNGEWDYASNFIYMADVFDDEQKDEMLHTLQALHNPETPIDSSSLETLPIIDKISNGDETRPKYQVVAKARHVKQPPDPSQSYAAGEKDFGIDDSLRSLPTNAAKPPAGKKTGLPPTSLKHDARTSKQPGIKPPRTGRGRTSRWVGVCQHLFTTLARSLSGNPGGILRFVLLLFAMVMVLSQQSIKRTFGRATNASWAALRRIVSLGKVSYI